MSRNEKEGHWTLQRSEDTTQSLQKECDSDRTEQQMENDWTRDGWVTYRRPRAGSSMQSGSVVKLAFTRADLTRQISPDPENMSEIVKNDEVPARC